MGRKRRQRAANSEDEDEEMEVDQEDDMAGRQRTGRSVNLNSRREDPEEVDTSDPVIAGLRASMDNLLQLVKDIIPTCNTEEKKSETTNRLISCMLKLVKTEMNYVQGLKLVDSTAETMSDIDEDADDTAILAHCERLQTTTLENVTTHRNNIKDSALKKHLHFKRLLEEIERQNTPSPAAPVASDDDEGDEDENAETDVADLEDDDGAELIPVIDPVTKLPLTDPVRNKYCHHVYGKASILGMLQGGNKTRCPTVGCSNKRWILEKHLQEDPELTVKVRKRVKEAQRTLRTNAKQDERNTLEI